MPAVAGRKGKEEGALPRDEAFFHSLRLITISHYHWTVLCFYFTKLILLDWQIDEPHWHILVLFGNTYKWTFLTKIHNKQVNSPSNLELHSDYDA
jgi:hypothetical protein